MLNLTKSDLDSVLKRRKQFADRFLILPDEERERLEYITNEALKQYNGPRVWDIGYRVSIEKWIERTTPSAIEYYKEYYELTDTEAVSKRLAEIEEQAENGTQYERAYKKIIEMATQSQDYKIAVTTWARLIDRTQLQPRTPEEISQEFLKNHWFEFSQYGEDNEKELLNLLADLNQTLEPIAGMRYEELEGKDLTAPIENILTHEQFDQYFRPFRENRKGEGYREAVERLARQALWAYTRYSPIGWRVDGKSLEERLKERMLKIIQDVTEKAIEEQKRLSQRNIEDLISTKEVGMLYPFTEPTRYITPHDRYTQAIGSKRLAEFYEEDALKLKLTYKKGETPDKDVLIGILVKQLTRELTQEDLALMSVIASLQYEKNKGTYKKSILAPLTISENQLIKAYYGLEGYDTRPEDKEWLSKKIDDLHNTKVRINLAEIIQKYPEVKNTLDQIIQEIAPGHKNSGILEDYELDLGPMLYAYPPNVKTDDHGFADEKDLTKLYTFRRYAITIYYGTLIGQTSILDMSLIKTPTLREGRSETEKIRPEVAEFIDELEKKNGLKIWKLKDGKRYISLKGSKEFPVMKHVILSNIEAHTYPGSIAIQTGKYTVNLDGLHDLIWPENDSKDMRRRHKIHMITYLIYLMNSRQSKIESFVLMKKGKTIAAEAVLKLRLPDQQKITS